MTCNCRSYNRPDWGGDEPEVVLPVPEWAGSERQTICVDACIADEVKVLWAARIWTLGSCCGHNGAAPRMVIVDRADREKAARLLRLIGRGTQIAAWELIYGDRHAAAEAHHAERVRGMLK